MSENVLEEKENKTKHFGDNEELPDLDGDVVIDKEYFQTEREVTIQKVYMNKFGKPCLQVTSDDVTLCGTVNINNAIYMTLKEKFGKTPAQWKGQEITLKAEWFEKGELKGWKLLLLN